MALVRPLATLAHTPRPPSPSAPSAQPAIATTSTVSALATRLFPRPAPDGYATRPCHIRYVLVNQPAESGALPPEPDLLAFLGQLPWGDLTSLPPRDTDAYVVQPVQRSLRRWCAAPRRAALVPRPCFAAPLSPTPLLGALLPPPSHPSH